MTRLALIATAVVCCYAAPTSISAQQETRDQVRSRAFLTRITTQVNRTLPRMLDRSTEMVVAVALDGVIVYQYRTPNHTADQVPNGMLEVLRAQITSTACETPDVVYVLRWGVVSRYVYFDKDYRYLFSFDVNAAGCGI